MLATELTERLRNQIVATVLDSAFSSLERAAPDGAKVHKRANIKGELAELGMFFLKEPNSKWNFTELLKNDASLHSDVIETLKESVSVGARF